jgi:hypothetical protein
MVAWLTRPGALQVSAALHALAFAALVGAAWAIVSAGGAAIQEVGLVALVGAILVAGVLLYFEQRWAEDVDLAFFKVNVFVGFAVLAVVVLARVAARL